MNTKTATFWIVCAAIVLLIAWDVYVAANDVKGDTISELMLAFARKHPILPFALGVLFGHLFWPQGGK